MEFSSNNNAVFDNLIGKLDGIKPEIYQSMATAAKDYFVEQFNNQGGKYGTWTRKVDGSIPTLVDTGNLLEQLENCDQDFRTEGNGVILEVNATNNGFDYGEYQQDSEGRVFFEMNQELSDIIKHIVDDDLFKLTY